MRPVANIANVKEAVREDEMRIFAIEVALKTYRNGRKEFDMLSVSYTIPNPRYDITDPVVLNLTIHTTNGDYNMDVQL